MRGSARLALNLALDFAPIKFACLRNGQSHFVAGHGAFEGLQFGDKPAGFGVAGNLLGDAPGFRRGQFPIQPCLQFQFQILVHSEFSLFKLASSEAIRRRA